MPQLIAEPRFDGVFDLQMRRIPSRQPGSTLPGAIDFSIKTKLNCGTFTCADTCRDTCCYTSKYC